MINVPGEFKVEIDTVKYVWRQNVEYPTTYDLFMDNLRVGSAEWSDEYGFENYTRLRVISEKKLSKMHRIL